MPRLVQGLKNKYPHIASLLEDLRTIKAQQSRVFQAYLSYTGMDPQQGYVSLYPFGIVLVKDERFAMRRIPQVELSQEMTGYAHYYGDNIQLRTTFADQYEALMKTDPLTGRDPNGQYLEERRGRSVRWHQKRARLLMQSKILHEMVHWARTTITFLPDPKAPDHGWKFEKAAYGKHLTQTSLQLMHYIYVPGTQ